MTMTMNEGLMTMMTKTRYCQKWFRWLEGGRGEGKLRLFQRAEVRHLQEQVQHQHHGISTPVHCWNHCQIARTTHTCNNFTEWTINCSLHHHSEFVTTQGIYSLIEIWWWQWQWKRAWWQMMSKTDQTLSEMITVIRRWEGRRWRTVALWNGRAGWKVNFL